MLDIADLGGDVTYKVVGATLGISHSRARQLEREALRKLAKVAREDGEASFLAGWVPAPPPPRRRRRRAA